VRGSVRRAGRAKRLVSGRSGRFLYRLSRWSSRCLEYRHRQQRSSKLIGQDRAIGQCLAAVRCQHVCAGQQATDHQRAVHAIRNLSRHFNASARQRPNLQLGQLGDRTAFAGKMRNVAQLGSPQVSLGKHSRWRAGAHSRQVDGAPLFLRRCWIGSAHATQAWWRCAVAIDGAGYFRSRCRAAT